LTGKYVNLSKGGKYLKCTYYDQYEEDTQVFKDSLECDDCNILGSYYIIGEKYEIGLCLQCLIKNSPYASIIGLKGYIVKDD
jgi:hypothetical protein